ncbi:hypothetical protein SDC9_164652 [bioreactor metagenome]|uniref:Uncharacterized protein n=1 Tax=bioreactor metagenome TaxID=1076179 RepID=A0A645FUV3_9ZZZZ
MLFPLAERKRTLISRKCYDNTKKYIFCYNNGVFCAPFMWDTLFHTGYLREPLYHSSPVMVARLAGYRIIDVRLPEKGEYRTASTRVHRSYPGMVLLPHGTE